MNFNFFVKIVYIKILYNFTKWNKLYLFIIILLLNIFFNINECGAMQSNPNLLIINFNNEIKNLNNANIADMIINNSNLYQIDNNYLNQYINITRTMIYNSQLSALTLSNLMQNPNFAFTRWNLYFVNTPSLLASVDLNLMITANLKENYLRVLFETVSFMIHANQFAIPINLNVIQSQYFSNIPIHHFNNFLIIYSYLINRP